MPKLKGDRHVLQPCDGAFPPALLDVSNPPDKLYIIGDPSALQEGLAIVGARNASPYGLSAVAHFGKIAAELGVVLISGGAHGCDSAAHKAALAAGGKTVVFFGGGCDNPYPARNFNLFQKIIDNGGAVVSENEWDSDCFKSAFIGRNRLIAGLSRATFVAEAGLPSGTFTTANFAINFGREVWTIPGSINFPGALGCNTLIYEGATPIITDEVFRSLLYDTFGVGDPPKASKKKLPKGVKVGSTGNPILEALMSQPMRPQELYDFALKKCGYHEVNSWLSTMLIEAENSGKIMKYKDGTYGPVVF